VIHEIEAALKGRRFRGVKIHVGECTLADYVIDPVLKLAGKYGALCLVDLGGRLDVAQRLAQAFPDTRLVIAHMGRYLAKDAALVDQFIRLAEQHRNVVLDTSGVALADKIVVAAKRIGSARLVWGTDGPHADPDTVTFARNELNKILKLDLAEADKANILGGSVRALLGLS
jgi:predicted TIM-barrel fold metal-dependent hydrolase